MMATRLTTLHTPWLTGLMRARVLNANWLYRWYSRPTLQAGGQANAEGKGGAAVVVRGEPGEHAMRQ